VKSEESKLKTQEMSMQRRHFEKIASILTSLKRVVDEDEHKKICEHFANDLSGTNANFNRDYFLIASGALEGKYTNKSR
jgi:hypothetical protein